MNALTLTSEDFSTSSPESICAALDYAAEQAEALAEQARAMKAAYLAGKASGTTCQFVQKVGGDEVELGVLRFEGSAPER